MKIKLSYIFAFTALLFAASMKAQEKRFVEVTVSDTVTLKFTKMIYEISMGNKYSYLGMDIPMEEEGDNATGTTAPTTSVSTITMILDKEKFPYTLSTDKNYGISSAASKSEPSVYIVINSEKELKKLHAMFKSQAGITGKISSTEFEPIAKYNDQLYKRLYALALSDAGKLAAAAGGTIGQVLSVSEKAPAGGGNLMDYYSELLKGVAAGMYAGKTDDPTWKTESITKTFKFELK